MSQTQFRTPVTAEPSPSPAPTVRASTTVINMLARAEGVRPTDLEVTLYDVIDPDALDALFSGPAADDIELEVAFEVAGYLVTVRGADHVIVTPT